MGSCPDFAQRDDAALAAKLFRIEEEKAKLRREHAERVAAVEDHLAQVRRESVESGRESGERIAALQKELFEARIWDHLFSIVAPMLTISANEAHDRPSHHDSSYGDRLGRPTTTRISYPATPFRDRTAPH